MLCPWIWRLKPNPMKTVISVFHLLNTSAARELRVHMEGQQLRHDPYPVYLDVTLDRTLTYRQHLTKTARQLPSRHNLLMKLAESSSGANRLGTGFYASTNFGNRGLLPYLHGLVFYDTVLRPLVDPCSTIARGSVDDKSA